jgi:hypothetical protein
VAPRPFLSPEAAATARAAVVLGLLGGIFAVVTVAGGLGPASVSDRYPAYSGCRST